MKAIFKLIVTVIYSLILFSSCTKTPDACFNYNSNATYYSGDTVQFQNCSSEGNSYYWEFGEGQTSTEINPSHVFRLFGDHSVKLTVTSNNGKKSNSTSKSVKINIPTQMIINKIVLTKFPETFIEPNISMVFSVDSIEIHANNQTYSNAKQGVEYTFDSGFPFTKIGENGWFGMAKLEFRNYNGTSNSPIIGSQEFSLGSLFYADLGDDRDFVAIRFASGIEFKVYVEMVN